MSPRPSPSSVRIFTNSFALPDPILSFLGRYCTCFSRCTIATSGRVADLWQAGVGWRESERPASVRPGSALPVATPLHNVHVCVPVPQLARRARCRRCFLSSYVSGLRTRLPPLLPDADGPPADLTQPAAVAVTDRTQQWPRSPRR